MGHKSISIIISLILFTISTNCKCQSGIRFIGFNQNCSFKLLFKKDNEVLELINGCEVTGFYSGTYTIVKDTFKLKFKEREVGNAKQMIESSLTFILSSDSTLTYVTNMKEAAMKLYLADEYFNKKLKN
jgi:hypothetical protein